MTIDGSTQPGAANRCGTSVDANGGITDRKLAIQIDGTNVPDVASVGENGINIQASNTVIRGLSVVRFRNYGIAATTSGATNATISCVHSGVLADGMTAASNRTSGVITYRNGTVVGGTDIADRNVLSGNNHYGIYDGLNNNSTTISNTTITGNYIGVGIDGMTAVGNQVAGILEYGIGSTVTGFNICLLYTSPSPRDLSTSRMPSSA